MNSEILNIHNGEDIVTRIKRQRRGRPRTMKNEYTTGNKETKTEKNGVA